MPLHARDATELTKKSEVPASRAFCAHDTGFYRSSKNTPHERFNAERWHGVWMEAAAHRSVLGEKKRLSIWVWIQLKVGICLSLRNSKLQIHMRYISAKTGCARAAFQARLGHLEVDPQAVLNNIVIIYTWQLRLLFWGFGLDLYAPGT